MDNARSPLLSIVGRHYKNAERPAFEEVQPTIPCSSLVGSARQNTARVHPVIPAECNHSTLSPRIEKRAACQPVGVQKIRPRVLTGNSATSTRTVIPLRARGPVDLQKCPEAQILVPRAGAFPSTCGGGYVKMFGPDAMVGAPRASASGTLMRLHLGESD